MVFRQNKTKVVRCRKQSDVLSDEMWCDVGSRVALSREMCGAMTEEDRSRISRSTLRCQEEREGDQCR